MNETPWFWGSLGCDAIFCRNVLMYFSPEIMNRVVTRLGQGLLPGGFLFLGHAETLRGLSHDYHLCHTHETFYYRRRLTTEGSEERRFAQRDELQREALPNLVEGSGSWVDVIQHASERITALTGERTPRALLETSTASEGSLLGGRRSPRAWDLGVALDLIAEERFADALCWLRELPSEAQADVDTLLLLSVILTNSGAHDEAEQTCKRLLALDELHSGAHYLMALCREHAGDREGAVDHDQTAIYLDPSFAMPHLHLGLVSKRGGDADLARRELSQAWILLAREDASRLVLFGGGFSREALVRLCQAERSRLGGET